MDEGVAEDGDGARAGLSYPWTEAPGPGEAVEAAPGLLWMRLPLPMVLDHINVWALRDGQGWAVVDTGVETAPVLGAWERALAGALEGRPVTRVVCTHLHPDHVGLAGWLTRRFRAPLLMTRLEYVTCRMLLADTGRPAPEAGVAFYRAAGWEEAALAGYRERFGRFGRGVSAFPDSYVRLSDGDTLEIGGRSWRVVVGNGHSPEHACLHQPELKLLIAGDQVLPVISSNVSVFPTEPDADPLADWMASLAKLKREIPDDVLVLPSHGRPFRGLHARLDELAQGHRISLERLARSLSQPKRAVDVFGALFARPIDGGLLGMATGESLAHLNRLAREGRAVRETDGDGVWWWRRQ
ncbi:MAG: MBL fold metallo-hydrolase [Pseudomonadota bacterium]|nr:MBL fold metallo-hydrolase [Pseudomonadota bacterium]